MGYFMSPFTYAMYYTLTDMRVWVYVFFKYSLKTSEEQDLQNFLEGVYLGTPYSHKIKIKVECAFVF